MTQSRKLIDKMPPAPSGDAQADIRALTDYATYIREQINYILTMIYRETEG